MHFADESVFSETIASRRDDNDDFARSKRHGHVEMARETLSDTVFHASEKGQFCDTAELSAQFCRPACVDTPNKVS